MHEPELVGYRFQRARTITELDRVAWNLPGPKPDQKHQPSQPPPVVASTRPPRPQKESGH
jgi:hypothetical protein